MYGSNAAANFSDSISVTVDKTNIKIYSGTNRSTMSADVTIQYTKTTDVPGSGSWGTDGVPMVHYDGNEKIVGTWFGETLYEKAFEFTPATDTNNHVIDATLTKSAISPKHIIKGVYELGGAYGGDSFSGNDIFANNVNDRMRVFVNANGLSYNFGYYNSEYPYTRAVVIIQYTKSS